MGNIELTAVKASSASTAAEFDYKNAARAILPRLAATSDNSERLRRLDDDAAAFLAKARDM